MVALLTLAWAAASWAVVPHTVRVSTGMEGAPPLAATSSSSPAVSSDGVFTAFVSAAQNLAPVVPGTANVFLKNRLTGSLELVNRHADGSPAASAGSPAISADGRYVAFTSSDAALVSGDTNGQADVFVRDRTLGTTERVSIASDGSQANNYLGRYVAISADGRFVVYCSFATNLVPNDTNLLPDVFLRDRALNTTERISPQNAGSELYHRLTISADGRYVAYTGYDPAGIFIGGGPLVRHVMLRDRVTGILEKLSVSTGGVAAEQECTDVSMSADGRHVVFSSMSNNLAPGGSPYWAKVFIRDRVAGLTGLVSRAIPAYAGSGSGMAAAISADGRNVVFASSAEIVPNRSAQFWALYLLNLDTDSAHQVDVGAGSAPSDRSFDPSRPAAISGNGRFVAFPSIGTNLDPADQNAGVDVYLRDVAGDTTRLLSATADGTQGVSGAFSANSVISADSQVVAFQSTAHNLVPGDANRAHDVFAWSRATGAMELVSIPAGGSASEGYDPDLSAGGGPLAISGTGRYVAFFTYVTLVPGDTNHEPDVFVRDREAMTATRVSLADDGAEGNRGAAPVGRLGMSGDGRFICFCSYSSNLVPGDTNERADVFVRDRLLNRTDGSGTGPERAGRCGRLSPGPGRSG